MSDSDSRQDDNAARNSGNTDVEAHADGGWIWDLAYKFLTSTDRRVVGRFYGLAAEDFDDAVAQGRLQERDRQIFCRGWALHNAAFVEVYPDTMEDEPAVAAAEDLPAPTMTGPTSRYAPEAPGSGDEHTEDEKIVIWSEAYDAVCGLESGVAVDFFRPAWREFDRLLNANQVREVDREEFLEAWAAHCLEFVEDNPLVLERRATTPPDDDSMSGEPR